MWPVKQHISPRPVHAEMKWTPLLIDKVRDLSFGHTVFPSGKHPQMSFLCRNYNKPFSVEQGSVLRSSKLA